MFRLIKSGNKGGGRLAFSTEDYDGDEFILRQSGRYAHSKTYIDSLCKQFDLKCATMRVGRVVKRKRNLSNSVYIFWIFKKLVILK